MLGALGDLSAGAVVSAEASLYLVPAGDADHAPPASANAIGTANLQATMLAPVSGAAAADDDCDGAPNMWDPAAGGRHAPPIVVGFPGSPVHVVVGGSPSFKVFSPQDGVVRMGRERSAVTLAARSERPLRDGDAVGCLASSTSRRRARARARRRSTRGT